MTLLGAYSPQINEIKIREYFGEKLLDSSIKTREIKKVIILFVNRSGSNFLSEAVSKTSNLNVAGEFFNYDAVINNSEEKGFTYFDQYVDWLINAWGNESGFITKMSWDQLYFLKNIGILDKHFSNCKFIFMRRENIYEQAASFYVAKERGQWTSYQPESNKEIELNVHELASYVRGIIESENYIRKFLSVYYKEVYEVEYDAFRSDPSFVLERLYAFIGVDQVQDFDGRSLITKKQSVTSKDILIEGYINLVGEY